MHPLRLLLAVSFKCQARFLCYSLLLSEDLQSSEPCEEVWLVPPPAGVKYRATMVRSRHASRGAERPEMMQHFGNVSRGGKTHVAFAQSLKFANASGRRRILFSDLSYFCHPDMPFIWDPQNSKWGKAKVITSYHKGYVGSKWIRGFTVSRIEVPAPTVQWSEKCDSLLWKS